MAKNNAHTGETKENRLKRFRDNPPYEIIATLLNSIANYFNNELVRTTKDDNYQSTLLILGIHSVALTISEGLFDKTGLEGYKLFLEKFVDGGTPDTRFSSVADTIHKWRNVLAHQWIGSIGHEIGYDYGMKLGWEMRDDVVFINPRIYLDCYLKAFAAGGRIWTWKSLLSEEEQKRAKERLIQKYLER